MNLKGKFDWNRKVSRRELSNVLLLLMVYLLGQMLCYAVFGDRHPITAIWVIVGAISCIGYALSIGIKRK